jgi:hypothetical protein
MWCIAEGDGGGSLTLRRGVARIFGCEFSRVARRKATRRSIQSSGDSRRRSEAVRKIALRDEAAMVAPESIIILRRYRRPFLSIFL